jgi:DNA relaxase NicK
MKLHIGLDWLRCTTEAPLSQCLPDLPDVEYAFFDHAKYGYNQAYGLDKFVIAAMFNESRPDMKTSIQLSGIGLQMIRDAGWTDLQIVRKYCDLGKITRIDVAIDLDNPEISPRDLWQSYELGTFKSITKNVTNVDQRGTDAGYTMYIGSWKSDRQIRVYDKSAQLKDLAAFVTRIELVGRSKRADAIARASTLAGVVPVAKREIISMVPSSGVAWFDDVIRRDASEFGALVPREDKSPEVFARRTVIPWLEKNADKLAPETRAMIALLATYGKQ